MQPLQLHPGIYQKINCMISLTICHATMHLSCIWHMILLVLPLDSAYLSVGSDTGCVLSLLNNNPGSGAFFGCASLCR